MSITFLGNPLIAELLADPAKFEEEGRSYQLLQEYFAGLPIETLRPLLRHKDDLVRHAALFVTSELGQDACALLDDAIPHIASTDRFQSFHAHEIVLVCAEGPLADRFIRITEGLESSDDVMRSLTMDLMSRADPSQLRAGADSLADARGRFDAHRRGLNLLANADRVAPEDVERLLASDDRLDQFYGAIAAKRLREKYPELLEHAASLADLSIRNFASEAR
jgi:hypothetical protein